MGLTITPFSAAIVLGEWIEEKGRNPKTSELNSRNGLPNYLTLRNIFGSIPSAVQASVLAMQDTDLFHKIFPGKIRDCMRCGAQMYSPGHHVRHCWKCRNALFETDEDAYDMPDFFKSVVSCEDFDIEIM